MTRNSKTDWGWPAKTLHWVGAAMILVAITVVTFIKLPKIINPPNSNPSVVLSASTTEPNPPNGKKVTICIVGRQYIWRYTYGNGCLNNYFQN